MTVFELTGNDRSLIGERQVVWNGCDFESVLRPLLERLVDKLASCDDAQCSHIAFAHDEDLFVVAWDVWLPASHMETWFVRARVLNQQPPRVEMVGKMTRAKDYADATSQISDEFDDVTELVLS